MKIVEYKGEMTTVQNIEAGQNIELQAPKSLARVVSIENEHARGYYDPGTGAYQNIPAKHVWVEVWDPSKKDFNYRQIVLPFDAPVKLLTGTMRATLDKRVAKLYAPNGILSPGFGKGTIGTDPEVFVEDKDGVVIPAWKFLPDKSPTRNTQNAPYADGAAAEWNSTPGGCLDGLTSTVKAGLFSVLAAALKENPSARLSIKTVYEFGSKELAAWKEKHRQFGCAPSQNIYGLMVDIPDDHSKIPFRSAGGHMHFSNGTWLRIPSNVVQVVKMLDATIGVLSVSAFEGLEDPRRREYYGLPGEYRMPKHGLEYRTLSNAWVFSPVVMQLFWDFARYAGVQGGLRGLRPCIEGSDEEVIDIIRGLDIKGARKYIQRNRAFFHKTLDNYYKHLGVADAGMHIFENGAASFVKDVADFEKNWDLSGKRVRDAEFGRVNRYPIYRFSEGAQEWIKGGRKGL
jgi:hypothetical protein